LIRDKGVIYSSPIEPIWGTQPNGCVPACMAMVAKSYGNSSQDKNYLMNFLINNYMNPYNGISGFDDFLNQINSMPGYSAARINKADLTTCPKKLKKNGSL
jgi:hypothetical protein